MKKYFLAAAIVAATSPSFAGSLADPVVESPVIVEQASSDSTGMLLPLILISLVFLAVSSSSGSSSSVAPVACGSACW